MYLVGLYTYTELCVSMHSTNGPLWYVTKMTTPSSRITKTGGEKSCISKHLSHVKRSQLLAASVKLIICGFLPFLQNMGVIIYNSHTSERWNSVLHPSPKKCTTWQYCRKQSSYETVKRYPSFGRYCRPHVCENTYCYSVKKAITNFFRVYGVHVLQPTWVLHTGR